MFDAQIKRKVEGNSVYEIKLKSRPSKAGIRQQFVISTRALLNMPPCCSQSSAYTHDVCPCVNFWNKLPFFKNDWCVGKYSVKIVLLVLHSLNLRGGEKKMLQ